MVQSLRTVKDGLIVGIIGYASVALLYATFDFFATRGSLYTLDLLGKALFKGLRDPAILVMPIELDMAVIFWYNVLHLITSLIIGLVVISLVRLSERKQSLVALVLFVIIAGFIITIAGVGFLTAHFRILLPWWSIVFANALAVILAGTYIIKRFPSVWKRLNPFVN